MNTYDDWDKIAWSDISARVHRLQCQIFQAALQNDARKTKKLQKLLLNSFHARLLAVRKVTQENEGRKTAGVDGIKSVTPQQRLELARALDLRPSQTTLRRVWIPKPGKSKKRPLAIPTIACRCQQALVLLALEPQWESRFEPNSYGFRPGRSRWDAASAIRKWIDKQAGGKHILDADIEGAFDEVNHDAILDKLDTVPAIRRLVSCWLKAKILDKGDTICPDSGVPQGSVIGPLLFNIALHGLEHAVVSSVGPTIQLNGVRTSWRAGFVRYADDIVVIHRDYQALLQCRVVLEQHLARIGLKLNATKTEVRHSVGTDKTDAGFNALGFHFRSFPVGKHQKTSQAIGLVTLVTPGKKGTRRHYQKLVEIIDRHRGRDQRSLISALNPVIMGWTESYRNCNASEAFKELDHHLWWKLWRWCKQRHSNKPAQWLRKRYWNNGSKPWQFGSKDTQFLKRHGEQSVTPHIKVAGRHSVYDRDRSYWKRKRNTVHPLKQKRDRMKQPAEERLVNTKGSDHPQGKPIPKENWSPPMLLG